MLDYMNVKEAAERWQITERQVQKLCAANRIPGAIQISRIWLISKDAKKPIDGRTKQGKEQINVSDIDN